MPRLLGLELHTVGFTLATAAPDGSIDLFKPDDRDGAVDLAIARARPWKWALTTAGGDPLAAAVAARLLAAVAVACGEPARAVVAVPSLWSEGERAPLLAAFERTGVEPMRLARETSALSVGASLADPSLSGLCALVDLGSHKLEMALAEVTDGMLRVLARESALGIDAERAGWGEVLGALHAMGQRLTRTAGIESRDVERVLTAGRRLALPSIAREVESIWGVPPELCAAGTVARGAARIAAGLDGVQSLWLLDDDLGDEPIERLQPPSRPPVSTVPPPPAPPSSPPAAAPVSEHPSIAPPGAAVAAVPPAGSFVGLASLPALRALDLVHPAAPAAFARPALMTLLNQFTFRREESGTLTLRWRDDVLALPIERGGVCVSYGERPRALRIGEWPEGTFTWQPHALPPTLLKHRTPMTAFVVAALRMRMRSFDDAAFNEAHAAKLALSPSVIRERRARLERLALPEAELRAVDHVVDGTRSFETMLGEGYVGRVTLHRLVLLLDLYGILDWARPTLTGVEDPVEAMGRLLARMQEANHFVALGVHWSASPAEIAAAWAQLQAEYGPEGRHAHHDRATAAAIARRGAAAWAVLRDDGMRVQHRREAYPGMDETLLAPLVEARAKALEMRGENQAAAEMNRLQREFAAVLPKPGKKE